MTNRCLWVCGSARFTRGGASRFSGFTGVFALPTVLPLREVKLSYK